MIIAIIFFVVLVIAIYYSETTLMYEVVLTNNDSDKPDLHKPDLYTKYTDTELEKNKTRVEWNRIQDRNKKTEEAFWLNQRTCKLCGCQKGVNIFKRLKGASSSSSSQFGAAILASGFIEGSSTSSSSFDTLKVWQCPDCNNEWEFGDYDLRNYKFHYNFPSDHFLWKINHYLDKKNSFYGKINLNAYLPFINSWDKKKVINKLIALERDEPEVFNERFEFIKEG
jgi:hypothetical protein